MKGLNSQNYFTGINHFKTELIKLKLQPPSKVEKVLLSKTFWIITLIISILLVGISFIVNQMQLSEQEEKYSEGLRQIIEEQRKWLVATDTLEEVNPTLKVFKLQNHNGLYNSAKGIMERLLDKDLLDSSLYFKYEKFIVPDTFYKNQRFSLKNSINYLDKKYYLQYSTFAFARMNSNEKIVKNDTFALSLLGKVHERLSSLYSENEKLDVPNYLRQTLGVDSFLNSTAYEPRLIFIGYKYKMNNPSDSTILIYRYPAYEELDNIGNYNPVKRPWWITAVGIDSMSFYAQEKITLESGEECQCGLRLPYSPITNSTPPPRAFWCIYKDRKRTIVLGVDFIFNFNFSALYEIMWLSYFSRKVC